MWLREWVRVEGGGDRGWDCWSGGGYEVRHWGTRYVLEAGERPVGGLDGARGDEVVFTDGTKQRCSWDAGNYQNVGPARLPSIHKTMLGYCRKFGWRCRSR